MKTRTRYINKLEELGALVNQLSEKTVLDVRASGRALAGDADAAESVLSGSKAARRLREAIEDGCLDIMLMQQPLVADDLREVTGAFRLVSDLAHIDEMTRDVAYLSQQLTPKAVSHLQGEFAEATDKVSNMVSLATKAFSQADAALAQRVFAMGRRGGRAVRPLRAGGGRSDSQRDAGRQPSARAAYGGEVFRAHGRRCRAHRKLGRFPRNGRACAKLCG